MQQRVTILRIARRVGFHFTTVAEALKNSVRVKPETRAKIQTVAREMGYVPDPMLAALCAYRKAIKPPVYHENIAWITSHPTRDGWRDSFEIFQKGAAQRAAELGFCLEEFWIKQSGMTSQEATQHLYNRGIRGLLVAPLFAARGHLSLDWSRFSTVALGYTLLKPRMNVVSTTHHRAVITAMRHLKAAGHRRIGWVGSSDVDERTDRLWLSGFLSERKEAYSGNAVHSFRAFDSRAFLEWFESYRPDAIISSNLSGGNRCLLDCLRERGYRVPSDVSLAGVNLQEGDTFSGVFEPNFLIGRSAVDLLTRMLQTGERGIPEHPLHQLIDGKWSDGKTIAVRNRKSKRAVSKVRRTPVSARATVA